jgi:hypothetical protein
MFNTSKKRTHVSNKSRRAAQAFAAVEHLESRQLLALVGIAPLTELPLTFYNSTGVLNYSSAADTLDVAATPTAVLLSSGPTTINSTHGDLQIHVRVSDSGALLGGAPGIDDLLVRGSVDLNGNGMIDPGESGTLLTGEVTRFGFQDSGAGDTTDQYDLAFAVTGGILAPYFAGRDIGLTLTSEHSSFTGGFASDFAGGAKGTLGPTPGPVPSSIGGFVYVDNNNNGQIDLGEAPIPNTTITLMGTDDAGRQVMQTTATDANGAYQFTGLRPGVYKLTETQPAGYNDGIDTIGTPGGQTFNDEFRNINLPAGFNGINNNFGEVLPPGVAIRGGDTATIGFWHNRNGQALIRSVNGGSTATALGNWLASSFPHLYGALAGTSNLAGKTNSQIADAFLTRFSVQGQKLDAQVMAVALACYVTNSSLAGGTAAAGYGFNVSATGTCTHTFNVGSSGAAFGVANGTTLTVLQILQYADSQAVNGVLYNFNTSLRNLANTIFDGINTRGDI